ncbi:methylenetetrahydrofolate reductase [Thermodesulfobacteriota bacterium]
MPLKEKFKSGKFVALGEFEPPKGSDLSPLLNNANLVRGRVDAIVVPEMANAVMKASSLGGGAFLQLNGFEPIIQMCCRDRNRLALQADILAAAGLGIKNVMAVSGDEIAYGDHHQARPVNDLDLIQLLEAVRGLCQGKDMAGIELKGVPDFFIGSSFNTGATGGALGVEIDELNKKIDTGIEFIVTTPVFDLHRFEQVLKRIEEKKIAIIPNVILLKSAGMARYIDRNIKHISIPAETIISVQKAPDKVQQCIKICGETVSQLKSMGVAGVMISTMGWEDKLSAVLDQAKL